MSLLSRVGGRAAVPPTGLKSYLRLPPTSPERTGFPSTLARGRVRFPIFTVPARTNYTSRGPTDQLFPCGRRK